jgi:hypothetical protein
MSRHKFLLLFKNGSLKINNFLPTVKGTVGLVATKKEETII